MDKGIYEGYKLLATNIILMAVQDIKGSKKNDVDKFINSEWFEVLAEFSGIDPRNARRAIVSGNIKNATLKRGKVCLQ
jgi:hypothetical protein